MLSNKPYLIRALYEWMVDNQWTPTLVANSQFPRCSVPKEFIEENGDIILNISPVAIRDLKMGNDKIDFRASFSGIVHMISIPVKAVLAIYPEESEQDGMYFDYEEAEDSDFIDPKAIDKVDASKRPTHLRLVD